MMWSAQRPHSCCRSRWPAAACCPCVGRDAVEQRSECRATAVASWASARRDQPPQPPRRRRRCCSAAGAGALARIGFCQRADPGVRAQLSRAGENPGTQAVPASELGQQLRICC